MKCKTLLIESKQKGMVFYELRKKECQKTTERIDF